MTGHGQKLSRNQERAIAALISSPSILGAAKNVGIGEKTLNRWLKLENFKTAYREAREQVVNQAIAGIQKSMADAVKALKDIMTDEQAPASARVSAARTIIDTALKSAEIEDLDRRISELEKAVKKRMS
jgi:hypothetical protein